MPGPNMDNPHVAEIMQAEEQIAIDLRDAASRPLSEPVSGGRSADKLVAALRADRDSW